MESKFKGTNIHIACKDESYYLLYDEPRCVKKSQFKKEDYCYVSNIFTNFTEHPIQKILIDCNMNCPSICDLSQEETSIVYLYTNGSLPVKSLNELQIKNLVKNIESRNKKCIVNQKHDGFSSIISVENEILISSALKGLNCTIIDCGYGTSLYKSLFPKINVISMNW